MVLSESFFGKNWPEYELDGLVSKMNSDHQILMPIWHDVGRVEVAARSPSLADKLALLTSDYSIDEIADKVAEVVAAQKLSNGKRTES